MLFEKNCEYCKNCKNYKKILFMNFKFLIFRDKQ